VSIIATESLARYYGKRVGIEDVSLDIPEGALYGFLGPNGAGKTTTIRVLLGFLRASRGRATVFGLDCWRATDRVKADVGYLPGDLRLYPWMTGTDALRIVGSVRGREMEAEGRRLAEQFDLDLGVRARTMSRGMRQKLGLILAMAHRPRLLILDEPSSGLDPLMQESLRRHLREAAASGRTVFFSSHTLSEVERLCDRIAILREGRVVVEARLEELRRRARRHVEIRWGTSEQADGPAPPFLRIRERRDHGWTCTLGGPVSELLSWAAGRPVEDLTIGRPDLEELFRSYYEKGAGP